MRDLDRRAAKAERVYWTDGVPTDWYSRPLARVQEELALALDLAERLDVIANADIGCGAKTLRCASVL